MNFGRYNVVFPFFLFSFFCLFPFFLSFFFACPKCSWCGLGTPTHFDLRDFRRRWRSGKKKVSESPPPPLISFFGTCATFGAGGGREKCVCPPHNPLRICAPAEVPSYPLLNLPLNYGITFLITIDSGNHDHRIEDLHLSLASLWHETSILLMTPISFPHMFLLNANRACVTVKWTRLEVQGRSEAIVQMFILCACPLDTLNPHPAK